MPCSWIARMVLLRYQWCVCIHESTLRSVYCRFPMQDSPNCLRLQVQYKIRGQCVIKHRFIFSHSPTLEVERIPCQYQINNQPCILNSNLCMMAGFSVSTYGRRRKRRNKDLKLDNYLNETAKLFYDNSLYTRSTYPRPSLNCVQLMFNFSVAFFHM